jgi:zinc transporter, ZIP family
VVGGVGGDLLARDASKHVLAFLLSFGAAALLYLVTEELLVETRLPEETLLSTAMFFLGFLAVFAFVAFAPDWGATANSGPTLPQAFASSRPQ